jgi:hypothetical protein
MSAFLAQLMQPTSPRVRRQRLTPHVRPLIRRNSCLCWTISPCKHSPSHHYPQGRTSKLPQQQRSQHPDIASPPPSRRSQNSNLRPRPGNHAIHLAQVPRNFEIYLSQSALPLSNTEQKCFLNLTLACRQIYIETAMLPFVVNT